MQKSSKKKLVLNRATIRVLTNAETGVVVGGISGVRCNPTETCHCTGMDTVCSCTGEPSQLCPTFNCQTMACG